MPKPSDKLKRVEAESYAAAWRRAGPALDAKGEPELVNELERRIERHVPPRD